MLTLLWNDYPLQTYPYHNTDPYAQEVMRLRFDVYEYIGEDDTDTYSLYRHRINRKVVAIW